MFARRAGKGPVRGSPQAHQRQTMISLSPSGDSASERGLPEVLRGGGPDAYRFAGKRYKQLS